MESNRKPSPQEIKLLELLIQKASVNFLSDWKSNLLVSPMNDEGMGSLLLFPNGEAKENRLLGERVSEYQFKDEDGVEVIASLNVDDNGELFELDMWRTDFNPLINIPSNLV